MLKQENVFHVGVVVTDIDATMREMTESLGLTWKVAKPMKTTVYDPDGSAREVDMRIAHSKEGPPRYELIQAVPGTVWVTPPGVAAHLHHVCYYSHDPAKDAAEYEARGYTRRLGAPGSPGGYFQSPQGRIIEIISAEYHDTLTRWIQKAG